MVAVATRVVRATASTMVSSPTPTPAPAPAPVRTGPVVVRTGPVVVVDVRGLALLGGTGRRELPGTGGALSPGLSHDARWVSWLTASAHGGSADLHLRDLRRPGADRVVPGATAYAWSPTGAWVAVVTGAGLRVLTPGSAQPGSAQPGSQRPTDIPGAFYGVVWSADGRRLGVSGRHTLVLDLAPAQAGVRVTRSLRLPAAYDNAYLARFTSAGLLLWPDQTGSASVAADGLRLVEVDLATFTASPLIVSLTYRDWVVGLPGNRVLVVAGGDRDAHLGKHPATYAVPGSSTGGPPVTSRPRPTAPAATVPAGSSLLSVAALADGTVATVAARAGPASGWAVDGTVHLRRPGGPDVTVAAAGHGVAAVVAARGGFLVLTRRTMELVSRDGGVRQLGPAGPVDRPYQAGLASIDYYGHVDTTQLVAVPAGGG